MSPSNSLTSNTYQNRALYNRASIQHLNVNNLLINDDNSLINEEFDDDELLVLITLNISDAKLLSDRIIFTSDNLTLNQWADRLIDKDYKNNRDKFDMNINTKYLYGEAIEILEGIFDEEIQGRLNATDNPPNAILNISTNFRNDYFIIITGLTRNENEYTLHFKSQQNSVKLIENEKVDVKITIDNFNPYNFPIICGRNSLLDIERLSNDIKKLIYVSWHGKSLESVRGTLQHTATRWVNRFSNNVLSDFQVANVFRFPFTNRYVVIKYNNYEHRVISLHITRIDLPVGNEISEQTNNERFLKGSTVTFTANHRTYTETIQYIIFYNGSFQFNLSDAGWLRIHLTNATTATITYNYHYFFRTISHTVSNLRLSSDTSE